MKRSGIEKHWGLVDAKAVHEASLRRKEREWEEAQEYVEITEKIKPELERLRVLGYRLVADRTSVLPTALNASMLLGGISLAGRY